MRKKIINTTFEEKVPSEEWLNLEALATVELSSEDTDYPIESAMLSDQNSEWRAAMPGKQTIRLVFDRPQRLQRIGLYFVESDTERTQEYVLRWCSEGKDSFHEMEPPISGRQEDRG